MTGSDLGSKLPLAPELRDQLLADPDLILSDAVLMRALVARNDARRGENVIDLRGLAMERLEGALGRLENTHRGVIAAAYENVAGMHMVHRAVLQLLEPDSFEDFLARLAGPVAQILRVEGLYLVLESHQPQDLPALPPLTNVVQAVPPTTVAAYLGDRAARLGPSTPEGLGARFGGQAPVAGSEAALRLDLGAGRLPGMLVLLADNPEQFERSHGTDLLGFFANVLERALRQWLK